MKKYLIRLSSALILLMFVVGVSQAVNKPVKQTNIQRTSFLFMVQGKGKITGSKTSGYRLILKKQPLIVVWFTDRPKRKAGSINVNEFIETWNQKKGNFSSEPPNAMLVFKHKKPNIVELVLLRNSSQHVEFKLVPLFNELKAGRGSVLLVIDPIYNVMDPGSF